MSKKYKNILYIEIALPILASILLIGIFLFIYSSVNLVSETNQNNFAYNIKIRNAIEEIDKIVERAEVNLNVLADAGYIIYDTSKLYDKNYNIAFINRFNVLTKAALINTPGINGSWYQANINLPYSQELYTWYIVKNGKYVDLKAFLEKTSSSERFLTPEDDAYYFDAVKKKGISWSKLYVDPDINVNMLTVSKPIYKNNKLIGVVGLDISVDNLLTAMSRIQKVFDKSEVYFVNLNGEPMLNYPETAKHNFIDVPHFKDLLKLKAQNKNEMIEYYEGGVKKVAVMLDLSCNEYKVVITFPNNLLFKGFSKLFKIVYFNFLLLIVMTIVILLNLRKIKEINKELENRAKKLETIFESSPYIIVLKDSKGNYLSCNHKFLTSLNIEKNKLIGHPAKDVFSSKLAQQIIDMENVVKETNKIVVYEACYKKADGTDLYLKKHVIPLFDVNNKLVEMLVIAVDITKNKQEHKLLKEAKELAEQNAIIKANFLANMSHEIRTPLNGVLGFIQLLKDTSLSAEQKELLNDTEKASEILLNIINDILDLSKIEADKLLIEEISFDLRALVEDITLLSTTNAEKKGIELGSIIYSNVPQRILGDPGRIRQILNNLISNSIKFTNKGEIIIYVSQISDTEGNTVIKFDVCDTGIGIPKDKLNLIFEEFTQADASTTRKFGGTGLGLAITQKLVKLMNGTIDVVSKEGEGSTFSVTLQFKKDNSVNDSQIKTIKSLYGIGILLMNDNPTDLKIINHYLKEADCNIYCAKTCLDAIRILNDERSKISLIIVDYKMQKTCEDELVCNNFDKIPIILYTSLAIRGDSIWAKEKGFKGYLTKPIKKLELLETINTVLNNNYSDTKFITKHVLNENKFNARAKILVVEDSEINCKLINKILESHGLYSDFAHNGQEAINAYMTNKYDLILMDCQMPILDGYQASEEIRKIEKTTGKHIPIIAITANVLDNEKEKCLSYGMDAYISKPLKVDELLTLINKYIDLNDTLEINVIIEKLTEELSLSRDESIQLIIESLTIFPKTIALLQIACNENNFKQMKELLHKIKGAALNLRLDNMSKLSVSFVEALDSNLGNEHYNKILNDMLAYFEHLNNIFIQYTSRTNK